MGDAADDVLGLSAVDALVGGFEFPVGDDLVGVDICFCTAVLLRELVCMVGGKGDLRGSIECCRGSDLLIVGAGAPSSLPRLGTRSNFSELDQIGPPLTVFGLP